MGGAREGEKEEVRSGKEGGREEGRQDGDGRTPGSQTRNLENRGAFIRRRNVDYLQGTQANFCLS